MTPEIITGWIEQTPKAFRFAAKVHQAITHFRRLKNTQKPLRSFLDSFQPLADARRRV